MPTQKTTIETYRAAIFPGDIVAPMMKPMIATIFEMVICQVRSLNFPEEWEAKRVKKVAITYGGAVRRRVLVLLKPRV